MMYEKVLHEVKQKQIAPVYLLYGTESYFIQNITKHITKAVLGEETEENLSVYDLEETPVQEVINDAETFPFFGGTKLIIANNPSFLKGKPDKLPFEHNLDILIQYINQPADYTVLVFTAYYEKIDERKKVSKAMKQHSITAECNPIKDYELKNWIKNLAGSMKVTIEDDVYDMLESELSTNLYQVQNELAKLASYVGENGVVTKDIADKLISHTETNSSLKLVDAVINRKLHEAISIYKDLEKMNEEPIALIALLAFQFRTILSVKLLSRKGYSQFQMQKQIGAHPFVIKMAAQRESKFTADRLKHIIEKLTQTDTIIKQGKMEKGLAFELLLYDLVQ
ncbi:DNA polymerase III subunit delta [Lentibacillus amyloliquefaciens]|uniref:DNA polymerase III subunit delta n=1 Tax=Lentibacillus amyloliquefaciens TaxID=1472767 RepID=A0A0U4G631_9BACI|nr:DNA polymerase III subunit delta [Lentibacillus amyloliquefaciens]ALX48138.1 DNA polymerase III subunit delta [Lentibacillus amyloliquefaciens]